MMQDSYELRRSWFGTYKTDDVQAYLDDLYIEIEKYLSDLARDTEEVQAENEILRQFIADSNILDEGITLPEVHKLAPSEWPALPIGRFKITGNGDFEAENLPNIEKNKEIHKKILSFYSNNSEKSGMIAPTRGIDAKENLFEIMHENNSNANTKDNSLNNDEFSENMPTDLQIELAELKSANVSLQAQLDFANKLLRDVYK
ncbi:hypothetical protein [Aerococcus agrisoli]|nr:hypothetical protein [Aerococcus agrisoli]